MNYLTFIVQILYIVITVKSQHMKFSQNKTLLSECIESYLLKDPRSQIKNNAKLIADISSEQLHGKILDMYEYRSSSRQVRKSLKMNHSNLFSKNLINKELKRLVNEGFEYCAERQNLPRFINEPRELSHVLDFILVDWPVPLYHMVRSQESRDILRMYAYDLGVKLLTALRYFSMDYKLFRQELQAIWMQRAQQYLDVSSSWHYLRHRFTTDRDETYSLIPLDKIHTVDYVIPQKSQGLTRHENPTDATFSLNQCILNMRKSYLETHLEQSYRILFFILELQTIGIVTAEDDVYTGAIPYNVLPEHIQRLVYHDQAYRDYLPFLRKRLEVEFSECFLSGTEEDLIVLFVQWIMKRNSSSTTTISTTITTPNYRQGTKKGGVRKKNGGKYFSPNKRLRTFNAEPNHHQDTSNVHMDQSSSFNSEPEESIVFMNVLDQFFTQSEFQYIQKDLCQNTLYRYQ